MVRVRAVCRSVGRRSFNSPVQTALFVRAPSATTMDLADVPNDAMLREMQRRLECMARPEKRVILVGALLRLCSARRVLLRCCRSRGALRSVAHDARHARRPAGLRQGDAVAED